jgi:uncharacterized heparinase superfamily protein
VTERAGFSARRTQALHRLHARWAGLARPATGFVSQPEPRSIGLYARGRQLVAGNFLFSGHLIEAAGLSIWDIAIPDPAFENEVQGFAWLDDLAAVGDSAARKRAQEWTWGWIARFGRGTGPGWTPDLTGRRIIRWINHALFLLNGHDRTATDAYYRALSRQTVFLSRRWQTAAPGLPRFEALTGLIYAGLALTGMERHVTRARAALARECAAEIDAEGGIPTRNPEELLEVFTLLTWAAQALTETGRRPGAAHLAAIERMTPTLRALRHCDGGLARFHGGGRGLEGRLDQALASSGVKPAPLSGLAMGFARLSGGRTSVIADAASPPEGMASTSAHASTLAFELTSGRRAVIVSCGSGAPFGADWRRAGRATASHSTLEIEGFSSSRLGGNRQEQLADRARVRLADLAVDPAAARLAMSHDGWQSTHGLTHMRHLTLTHDGRQLTGEDTLDAVTPADRRRFEQVMTRTRLQGIHFMVRFHLHPDVDAAIDMGGAAVSLALKSGELWIFRHSGGADLSLDPSVYLEKGRLKPRPTKQIVLSATLHRSEARIGWTLAKAQDTPLAIRDLDRDDLAALA